jgi:hypothetical protein
MIIKSSLYNEKIAEVPIILHPDGRKSHPPHLKTFRDGWRTLRFFLMYSPRSLFLVPGTLLILLGLVGYALALPGVRIGNALLGPHTLLFASLAILCGFQAIAFAVLTKLFAIREGMMPSDTRLAQAMKVVPLERALILSACTLVGGLAFLFWAFLQWQAVDFGSLDYGRTMRVAIPGATLTALGVQGIFSAFMASILEMRRK